ncbi:MAG: PHP domain-containing protein [Candidatus Omnitrophica bacterium]|nr:PHP domain-containing protein [Candidatus Omnitrophota bacterium]MDD5654669.1 PHP domain-containing protein [Candidatus Omnitrophota bacterium]
MKYCDLHLHTVYSDSTYTPEELARKASGAGLGVIAVTDHDTVSGIAPAIEAAKQHNIEVIPAIELTAELNGLEVHILGYFIDYLEKNFVKKLESLKEARIRRLYKMIEKLQALGISLNADSVLGMCHGKGSVGRLHIARALVKEGYCRHTGEAFEKYIGDKGPAYVCGFRFKPAEVIRMIRNTAGGCCVLAHPYSLRNDMLIPALVDEGIQGLEVYYPEHNASMIERYKSMAREYGLVLTGGSDCHGSAKPESRIGSIKVPYELVEKLKGARGRRL